MPQPKQGPVFYPQTDRETFLFFPNEKPSLPVEKIAGIYTSQQETERTCGGGRALGAARASRPFDGASLHSCGS